MFIDSFQEKIWRDKYQYKNETFEQFCNRISVTLFPNDDVSRLNLYNSLLNFEVLFGGRINANIGIAEEGLTLFNCFIMTIKDGGDSLDNILESMSRYTKTLKTEGGVGFCANYLRPAGTLIKKIGVTTPGAVKFLEAYDKLSEIITAGSVDVNNSFQGIPTKKSIRKGATMATLSICHPDIEEFITAKAVPNRLTKMNMSVLVTDAFMFAVENNLDWDLWFPDIAFDKYDTEWDGNFEKWSEKNYPYVIYKTVKAVDLWELLLKSSYCVSGDLIVPAYIDNVLTNMSIEEVHNNFKNGIGIDVLSVNRETFKIERKPVVSSIYNGKKELITIKTQSNFKYRCTKDHRLFGISPGEPLYEKKVKKFKVGDYIARVNLTNIECTTTNNSHDWETFAGLILGDGSVRNGHVRVAVNTLQFNEVEPLLLRIASTYNRELKLYKDKRSDNWIEVNIHSTALSNDLKKYMYCGDFTSKRTSIKIVPHCLFTTTDLDSVKCFLSGYLSADGCMNGQKTTFYSKYEHLSIGIQRLLLRIGVISRKYKIIHKKFGSVGYRVDIDFINAKILFEAIPSFLIESKVKRMVDVNGYKAPIKIMKYTDIKSVSNKSELFNRNGTTNSSNFPTEYEKLFNGNVVHEKVVYTNKAEKTFSVYDIGVADNENFICIDGGLYHNCRNEPGIIFIDTVRRMNNLFYLKNSDILSPNPCSEVFGSTGTVVVDGEEKLVSDVCCLGSINIVKFYDTETCRFDIDGFLDSASIMVKALDNTIDISDFPLDEYRDGAMLKRKIGVGITGPGSLFMMMNTRYGSAESIEFLEEVLGKFMNRLYQTSALLAKEKGPFPLYDSKMLEGGYVKNSGILTDETLSMIRKYGLRNSALCALAPNGSLSILAGNVSGGLEPVFSKEYIRWNRVEGTTTKFEYPDVHKNEWFETDYFKETSVNNEKYLMATDEKYRVDKNNGLCKKELIQDYGYKIAKQKGFVEVAGATELTIEEHLNVLSVFSKYVDQSSSKTINISDSITFEDFKNLYGKLYKYGIKGCTTYREGTSVAVLETQKQAKNKTVKQQQKEFLDVFKEQANGDVVATSVKLPEEYPAKGYILKSDGRKYYVHVAFKDKACTKPFAIFVNTNNKEDNTLTFNALEKLEDVAIAKGINLHFIEETKKKYAYQKNPVKICRMLGLLLRHNVDVLTIVKGLSELDATVGTFVFHIKKFLSQFVQDHKVEGMACPECGEKSIMFREGCFMCTQCFYSKCG